MRWLLPDDKRRRAVNLGDPSTGEWRESWRPMPHREATGGSLGSARSIRREPENRRKRPGRANSRQWTLQLSIRLFVQAHMWLPEYAEVRTHSPGLGKSWVRVGGNWAKTAEGKL